MTSLLDAVEQAGRALEAVGGSFRFHPEDWLWRDTPVALSAPGRVSANGQCRLVRCADGWSAVNLAREVDRELIPALIGAEPGADVWASVEATAASLSCEAWRAQACLLHMPVSILGEAQPLEEPSYDVSRVRSGLPRVLDLSALWAGPACAGLLAEAGCAVTRVESLRRPDPTPHASPQLDARINGGKTRINGELDDPDMLERIGMCDILVTSGRPHALARVGLTPDRVFAAQPNLIWVAITAHGWHGDAGMRVGFGDDCAVAGGLVCAGPQFMGDALADPLTGLVSATRALAMWQAGRGGLIDVPLARTAASFAQRIGLR